MPSPFPGMDPYLEDPTLWPDVHGRLINAASELLLSQLRPRYFVQIDERLYLANDNDDAREVIVPDIRIRKVNPGPSRGGTAVLAAPGFQLGYSFEFDVHESYLKLVDRESNNVITVIEILSPANKVRNSVGRRDYESKRNDVLSGGTHFVEIDLLREGTPLAAQPPLLSGVYEYMAQAWRFAKGELKPTRWVWPMSIMEPLKPIPIPVKPQDPDAVLDLQRMLEMAYERAGYELRVNYHKAPRPPLTGELSDWASSILANQPRS
jgi:hypothetical protein